MYEKRTVTNDTEHMKLLKLLLLDKDNNIVKEYKQEDYI